MVYQPTDHDLQSLYDPLQFVPQMIIRDRQGRQTSLMNAKHEDGTIGLYDEQWLTLDLLKNHNQVAILKARKLGITTIGQAYFTHRAITQPGSHNVLCIGHEEGSCRTMNRMQDVYLDGIQRPPFPGQPGMGFGGALFERGKPTNTETNTILQGLDRSSLMTLQAGGRGSGRSATYQGLHASEAAFYPRGSSATGKSGKNTDETADDAMWAAALSSLTMDGNHRVLCESTADGPTGLFHKIWQAAIRSGSNWAHEFFGWDTCAMYQMTPWEGFELNDEEQGLATRHGLTMRQLAWRRAKLSEPGYSLGRFRKEYPLTELEPFMTSGNLWYPVEEINILAGGIIDTETVRTGWRYYGEYDAERTYFMGVDPAGGVGRDYSVAMVMSDRGHVVAVFTDNHTDPKAFANLVYRESLLWGRKENADRTRGACILVEQNNMGQSVIDRLTELRANLWKTGTDRSPKDYWATTESKLALVSELRAALLNRYLRINDNETLAELITIREQKNGNVEADEGHHDDHASALALCWWNARQHVKLEIGRMTAERQAQNINQDREFEVQRRRQHVDNVVSPEVAEANNARRAKAMRRLRDGR